MDGGSYENSYITKLITVTDGEWAGWSCYPGGDPFEDLAGPFYYRVGEDGRPVCAFRAERKHMNGGGFMHGGCMMTFADYSLFAIGWTQLEGVRAVTVSLNGEFLGPAKVGDLVEATGEVTKAGGSLLFVRGLVSTAGAPMLNFSGVIKKIRAR